MSLLRKLFGPSKEAVWADLAQQLGGTFHSGGFFAQAAVQAEVGDWIITLDTVDQGDGKTSQPYTRLRAPYVNPEGFTFRIYRASVFSGIGRALGMEDVKTGDRFFDQNFIVQSNDHSRVCALLANDEIRRLIAMQPRIMLEVKDDEGWFKAKFPNGVDELQFMAAGVIKDLNQLKSLFTLFSETLRQLCHGGSAYEDDVKLHIRRLSGPGGRIEDRVLLWEGDTPRREAADALGRLGDPQAVAALAAVLRDVDDVVRAKAIDALAKISHEKAVRPLIPLIGDSRHADGVRIRDRVADALRNLGESVVVHALLEAFEGRYDPLMAYEGPYRKQIVQALTDALDGFSGIHAAWALKEINAVEALPALRTASRSAGKRNALGQSLVATIQALEARAALPRPAESGPAHRPTLPSPAGEPGLDPATLPRVPEDDVEGR